MSETNDQQRQSLSDEELERANGEPLPDREAMSVIRTHLPAPDVTTLPIEPVDQ